MYKYETHMHTSPVSRCAGADVESSLRFYKKMGYDGVFITNHFIDGNIRIDSDMTYAEKIEFYYSDYEAALALSGKIGIKVFDGFESSYKGTDFLVYGIGKDRLLKHPEIETMKMRRKLEFFRENGAFVVQAHPFREAGYIDHIRLFPRQIDAVEVVNACRTDFENSMAKMYAESYGLLEIAGSDNHHADKIERLAGIETETPILSTNDFIAAVKNKKTRICSITVSR